jgi:hypothetical protein
MSKRIPRYMFRFNPHENIRCAALTMSAQCLGFEDCMMEACTTVVVDSQEIISDNISPLPTGVN